MSRSDKNLSLTLSKFWATVIKLVSPYQSFELQRRNSLSASLSAPKFHRQTHSYHQSKNKQIKNGTWKKTNKVVYSGYYNSLTSITIFNSLKCYNIAYSVKSNSLLWFTAKFVICTVIFRKTRNWLTVYQATLHIYLWQILNAQKRQTTFWKWQD